MNEANRVYHDTEWGIPVHDDRHMFEHLTLECMQCGLSWDLMLKKREIFRQCFDYFDYNKIAAYSDSDVEHILNTEYVTFCLAACFAVIPFLHSGSGRGRRYSDAWDADAAQNSLLYDTNLDIYQICRAPISKTLEWNQTGGRKL